MISTNALLTNAAELEEFMRAIVRNPRFLYAAFAFFDNKDMMEFMETMVRMP